eukprot:TRINITY_DN190462_c0_g1_i1.p1 TRINITY_DN190462_c0_g1~~TRINITY_DN190462_c0_g1_i1.p1  ORF type:complete len:211 (+),score=31.22 TRINITY_DN190462_c0_g1_i1:164-796(+)
MDANILQPIIFSGRNVIAFHNRLSNFALVSEITQAYPCLPFQKLTNKLWIIYLLKFSILKTCNTKFYFLRSNNRMTPKAPQYPSKATPHHRNRANNNNGPMNSVARNGRPPQSGMKSNSKQKTKYTRLNSKAMERHESSTYSVDSVDEAKDVFQVSGDLDDILNSLGANDPSRTPPVGAVLNYPNNIMRHLDDPNTNNKTEEEILEMMLR